MYAMLRWTINESWQKGAHKYSFYLLATLQDARILCCYHPLTPIKPETMTSSWLNNICGRSIFYEQNWTLLGTNKRTRQKESNKPERQWQVLDRLFWVNLLMHARTICGEKCYTNLLHIHEGMAEWEVWIQSPQICNSLEAGRIDALEPEVAAASNKNLLSSEEPKDCPL